MSTPSIPPHVLPDKPLNQYQTVNVQCTRAKIEIYKIRQHIEQMTHTQAKEQAMELFQRAYDAFDRLQAFIGSRG